MTGLVEGRKDLCTDFAKRYGKVLRYNIQEITWLAIRRLTNLGGVKRISGSISVEKQEEY